MIAIGSDHAAADLRHIVKAYLEGKGLTCNVYTFTDTNDFRTVAESAANAVDVIYVPTDNTVANNADTLGVICNEKNVPVVAGEEGICKKCGIVSLSISYYNLGVKTGKMAAEILLGKADVKNMAIAYDESPVKKYNEALCTKYGITVPSGYVKLEVPEN